ncbi:hypothetical protein [Pararhodobacter sp. SW119]|uniref:hypothetical protein n=1 Tax=Pararhodobacter sp. SW119 TaxID=2780075 RepID=UPI001ADF0AF4|nr:hypothetical protein [Pararhodobacter sp. SW119]
MRNSHQSAAVFGILLCVIALIVFAPLSGVRHTVVGEPTAGFTEAEMRDAHASHGAQTATGGPTEACPFCAEHHDHASHATMGGCGAVGCASAALILEILAGAGTDPKRSGPSFDRSMVSHPPDDLFRPPRAI